MKKQFENKSKDEFLTIVKNRYALRVVMSGIYENVFCPLLDKFDGKIFNKRFVDAFTKGANNYLQENKSRLLIYCPGSCGERRFYSRSYESVGEPKHYVTFYFTARVDRWNYNVTEDIYFAISLNDEGRILAKDTKEREVFKRWAVSNFDSTTDAMKDTIDNYDEYILQVGQLLDYISKINALPYIFRENLYKYSFNLYLG